MQLRKGNSDTMNIKHSSKILTVTDAPHIKSPIKTKNIMADVIISLMPALFWAVYIFGPRSLTVTAISVISCVIFEAISRKSMKKPSSVNDLSAVVTGILLAYSLPVSVPLWIPAAGAFFAIVIVKQLFGGIGKNIVNPALAARVFLSVIYPDALTSFTKPHQHLPALKASVDIPKEIVAGATPLAVIKNGNIPYEEANACLLGDIPGCIGEISATLLILGGIYLIARRVISWHIPATFLATVAFISFIFPAENFSRAEFMQYQLFCGGLILGAVFMATDYVTSPVTKKAKVIFGAGCGLITIFFRYFIGYPEGVAFAILIMNLFAWYFALPKKQLFVKIKPKCKVNKSTENHQPKNAERYRAQVMCSGTNELSVKKYIYAGIKDCVSANMLSGGDKLCPDGCIGLGTCAVSCKFDAIHIINGVAAVDYKKCTGCGECIIACPKKIIKLIPYNAKHWVGCSNTDKASNTNNYCNIGCIGCKACENN